MAVRKRLSVAQVKDIAGRQKTADITCLVKKESHIEFFDDRKKLFASITGVKISVFQMKTTYLTCSCFWNPLWNYTALLKKQQPLFLYANFSHFNSSTLWSGHFFHIWLI